ncbi:hypothetical protein HRbin20_00287 [bacterium HR20]|nr:hypothetical protein HRbin20_00287 [bacterium HR20]
MRTLLLLLVPTIAIATEGSIGIWAGSAPAAPRLFNDGLWRGASAAVEATLKLPTTSVLFEVPLSITLGAEYVRPTATSTELLDDYRGWILRGSLVWYASGGTAPYLRLGGGASFGERYARTVEWDTASPLQWQRRPSFAVFWGIGVRGMVAQHVEWAVEAECLAGDQVGLLLPLRLGLFYRWGDR